MLFPQRKAWLFIVVLVFIGSSVGAEENRVYWSFNGNAEDSWGGVHDNGMIYGANFTIGYSGECLKFDGVDDYLFVPDSNDLNFANKIKIDFWVNFYNDDRNARNRKIIEKEGAYAVRIHKDGKIGLRWNGSWYESISLHWTYEKWHHVEVVHDGGFIRFFRDGVICGKVDNTESTTLNDNPLWIGRGVAGEKEWLPGRLDELKLSVPDQQTLFLSIDNVSRNRNSLRKFEKLEVTMEITGDYHNPFDPVNGIEVWASIIDPDGVELYHPGFYHQDFAVDTWNREISPSGNPGWKLRFTPRKVGSYSYTIHAKTPVTGEHVTNGPHFLAVNEADPNTRGFVRKRSIGDRRYYEFENTGQSFYQAGFNMDVTEMTRTVQWSGKRPFDDVEHRYRGLFGDGLDFPDGGNNSGFWPAQGPTKRNLYEVYETCKWLMDQLGNNSIPGFTVRFRAEPAWIPLEMSRNPEFSSQGLPAGFEDGTPGFGVGEYNFANCWILDKVISWGEAKGLLINVCNWDSWRRWDGNYSWDEDEEYVKRRLRYMVARWGYSPALFSLEYFNERAVGDEMPGGKPPLEDPQNDPFWGPITSWLRALDVHGHIVSNTYAGIDHEQLKHQYPDENENYLELGFEPGTSEPFCDYEYGQKNYRRKEVGWDPQGYYAHEGVWAHLMSHYSSALYWWAYNHLYHRHKIDGVNIMGNLFKGIAVFLDGEDLGSHGFCSCNISKSSGPGGIAVARALVGQETGAAFVWLVRTPCDELTDRPAMDGNVWTLSSSYLKDGTYTVEWRDTWSGKLIKTETGVSCSGGEIKIHQPDGVERDVAAKVFQHIVPRFSGVHPWLMLLLLGV